jgi:hypothetical protein
MLPGYLTDAILAAATVGTISYLAYMFLFTTPENVTVPEDPTSTVPVPEDISKGVDLTMGDVYADMASDMADKETNPGIAGLIPGGDF